MLDKFTQMDLKLWWTKYLFAWTINNCLWYNLIYAFHCVSEQRIGDPWYTTILNVLVWKQLSDTDSE